MQCNIPLIGLWNVWPQDLQLSVPMLVLRSNLTVTPVSWLQKTHLKAVGSGSRWRKSRAVSVEIPARARAAHRKAIAFHQSLCRRTFLGPTGPREDFLRLPIVS